MHKVTSGWYLDLLATSTAITLSFIRQDAVVLWGGAVSVSSPNTGTVTV